MKTSGAVGSFLAACVARDGFVALGGADVEWRLGAVLFARHERKIAVVRKAPREGYAFGGKWSLPGGMVRVNGETDVGSAVVQSLAERARREAGLDLSGFKLAEDLGPVVTSYHARGRERRTLITAFETDLDASEPLIPEDPSVDAARWADVDDLPELAPANRLIVGHLVWEDLDDDAGNAGRPDIEAALRECSLAAARVSVSAPVAPWAAEDDLRAWRSSWPLRPGTT